jgi:hypothetical protein
MNFVWTKEEEEKKRKEEQERLEHEEYLKLKESFSVEGEGSGEQDLQEEVTLFGKCGHLGWCLGATLRLLESLINYPSILTPNCSK